MFLGQWCSVQMVCTLSGWIALLTDYILKASLTAEIAPLS